MSHHGEHKLTFHSETGDVILFKDWVLTGPKETYLSCIFLALLGIFYQGLRFARHQYGRRCSNLQCRRYILNKGHLLQTAMYILQFLWGYFLMLAVMTYNVYVLAAVLTGLGLGYFFFSWGEFESRNGVKSLVGSRHVCTDRTELNEQLLSLSSSSALTNSQVIMTPSTSSTAVMKSCHCDENTVL